MKRIAYPSAGLLVIGLGLAAMLLLVGRWSVGQSPDSWRQLALPDFVREIEAVTTATPPPTETIWTEIRSQSAARLLQIVRGATAADYGNLVSLYLWAKPTLTAEENTTVLAALTPAANATSSWAFAKLQTVHARMIEAQMPQAQRDALVLGWLDARDVRTIDNVDQLGWLTAQVALADRTDTAPTQFTAQWTGTIQAPADGDYRLSICPLKLDFKLYARFRTQTTALWIGGQKVLDTARDGATHQTAPITLSASGKTPLRMEVAYACSDPAAFAARPAVALLWWQRSGMAQQLVPGTALATADGRATGLAATYVLGTGAQQRTVKRTDSQLNFIWSHGSLVDPSHGQLRRDLATQLLAVATDPATLAQWEQDHGAAASDWPGANWAVLEALDAPQRQQWAETLLAHPVLLADCSLSAAVSLYQACRFGTLPGALDGFGRWSQAHAEQLPQLVLDFYQINRAPYREMARMILWQYPPHRQQLEQNYLTLGDGSCVLPVAYTLAYAHWNAKQIGPWIDTLQAHAANKQLSGDQRSGWVLARAPAEEIRRSRPDRFRRVLQRYLAGQPWLQEATLTAQSETARLDAYLQWAARCGAAQNLPAARHVLDTAEKRCTSTASGATLTAWRAALEQLASAIQTQHQQQENLAREGYVTRLEQRRQKALERGDSQAANRYDQLLADAGATN